MIFPTYLYPSPGDLGDDVPHDTKGDGGVVYRGGGGVKIGLRVG